MSVGKAESESAVSGVCRRQQVNAPDQERIAHEHRPQEPRS